MAPRSVVKHFDAFEDLGFREFSRFIDTFSDSLLFQTAKEPLRNRIVPTVATLTHARREIVRSTEQQLIITAVLRALVGVHEYALLWLPTPFSHQQGNQHELASSVGFIDQPTMLRAYMSSTAARYNHPCRVRM